MTIEIGNSVTLSQQPAPGEETRTGLAQKNATHAQAETGKPVDSVQITENAHRLQSLQESISSLPVVDTQRVEAAVQKIQSRAFQILGHSEQRLTSAEKIADRLLSLDSQLPKTKDFDEA